MDTSQDLRHYLFVVHAFSYKQHFLISNARVKLAKNKTNAKQQHPETEFCYFENYSHSSSTLSSKNNRTFEKIIKRTSVSVFMR